MNHYVKNLTNLMAHVIIYDLTGLLLRLVFWRISDTEEG